MIGELSQLLASKGIEATAREMTSEEYDRFMVERWNSKPGTLTGFDCPECLNRGFSYRIMDGYVVTSKCSCMAIREAQHRLEHSGISQAMQRLSFDSYQTPDPWQAAAKQAAQEYAASPSEWFFAGGQVGSGKTHLCTAILRELSLRYAVRYMLWRDDSAKIKAALNDPAGVELMDQLKRAPVLYIDDLFKGAEPTKGDSNLAFELLNYRYNDERLLTIISTERYIDELVGIDEGIGSRIAERSRGHRIEISRDLARNWRLRD